jgi:hypothetical protein
MVGWLVGWVGCGEPLHGASGFGCVRTDQTFCLIFLPRTTGAYTRAGKCAGPIRCLSDVDGLFQQRQDCGLRGEEPCIRFLGQLRD